MTPHKTLMTAVVDGDIAAVKTAIAAGIDVNDAANADAAQSSHALYWAAFGGHTEVARLLLAAGANVHADRDAALRWAAYRGHVEIVRLLLAAAADVHAVDDVALSLAARHGHGDIVHLLLAAGADPLAAWSMTPRQYHPAVIEILDTCADLMTPDQCIALAKESVLFVHAQARMASSKCRRRLQR